MEAIAYPIILALLCFGLIALVLVGYPALLWLCGLVSRPETADRSGAFHDLPTLDVVTVVRNGERLIAQKIINTFEVDYPRDRLRMLCFSDGSTDRTAEIIRSFDGPRLLAGIECEHLGKNATINRAVERCTAEILVFTDADAALERDALRLLVQPMMEASEVGGVCGRRQIGEETRSAVEGQHSYLRFDSRIKLRESRLGSITSNDGKLYAMRRALVRPMPDGVTDDLYNGLSVVAQGYRLVFQPSAVARTCVPSRSDAHEVDRRRRIVARSLRSIYLNRELLNPLRHGVYAAGLLINKVLRRALPAALLGLLAASVWHTILDPRGSWLLLPQVLFYTVGIVHLVAGDALHRSVARRTHVIAYFCVGNLGTLLGVIDFLLGRTVVKWDPLKHDVRTVGRNAERSA